MADNRSRFIDLAYDEYDGTDELTPPIASVVILHGMLDCKENWKEIAKSIADKTVTKVYALDLRNHGDNQKSSDFSFNSLLGDVRKFVQKLNEPVVLIGHSFGGSLAIKLALEEPKLIKKLILVDISPLDYPEDTEYVISLILKVMKAAFHYVPNCSSLEEVKKEMKAYLDKKYMNSSIQKLILPTLMKTENGFKWKTNLEAIEKYVCTNQIMKKEYPFSGHYKRPVLLVHAQLSNYVNKEDYEDIKQIFPNSTFACIKGSHHWIHTEQQIELTEAILTFLLKK